MFVLTLPNAITIARLAAVPVVVWLIVTGRTGAAFWLFLAAGLSDAVDGFIARAFRARSRLGAWLDPLADKALLVGVYLALGVGGLVPAWLVVLIVARDVVIVGGIGILTLMRERLAVQPLVIGKLNTAAQIGLAGLVLAVDGPGLAAAEWVEPGIWLVASTTAASLVAYVLRGLLLLRTRDMVNGLAAREPQRPEDEG